MFAAKAAPTIRGFDNNLVACSRIFAVLLRWPGQGSPSLASPFSGAIPSLRNPAPLGHRTEPYLARSFTGAKAHQTFALVLLTHRIFASYCHIKTLR